MDIEAVHNTGATLFATLQRTNNSEYWQEASTEWGAGTTVGNLKIALNEQDEPFKRRYTGSSGDVGSPGEVIVRIHDDNDSDAVIGKATVVVESNAIVDVPSETRTAVGNLNDFDPANDTVANVTLVATTTTNTDMRGTDSAATFAQVDALVDEVADVAADVGGLAPGTTQPRVNDPAGDAFQLKLSSRNDGTHKCTKPVRIRPGLVGDLAVSIDTSPLYGDSKVVTVGTPTVSGSSSVTATALGPRDEIDGQRLAMIELAGTATANERETVTVPITLRTGESFGAVFDLWGLAD